MYMTSKKFHVYEFESVVILALEKAETKKNKRRKRALPAIIGINAVAVVR